MVSKKVSAKTESKSAKKNPAKQTTDNLGGNSRKRESNDKSDTNVVKRPRLDICDASKLPDGVLLTLGQGDMGQLGLGDEILSRKKPAIVKKIADVRIKKIAAGALHTVCLTSDNKLYSFGCNDEFALGRITDEDEQPEYLPSLIEGPLSAHKVAHITAGDSHTMALTSEGKVFLWGVFRDSHGKLGLLTENKVCEEPTLIPSLAEAIISIASGNDHIVMVSYTGKVYTMGNAEQGQLGRVARYFADRRDQRRNAASTAKSLLRPQKVFIHKVGKNEKSRTVMRAFAGAYTSWVLTNDELVYAWGLNNFNQLGFPDYHNRYRAEFCPSLSSMNVKHIAGGEHHSVVLDDRGRVYTMGRGDYGRLGLDANIKQADKLMRIDTLQDVASISACSSVSFAVDSKGAAYGWGFGSNLQLTTGEEDDEWSPIRMSGKNLEERNVLDVAAGGQHTVMLASLKIADET